MDIYETIRTRKSVRSYLDKPVEEEKLDRVLEAARLAPSARNRQEWRFVVVTDPTTRRKLVDAASGQEFVGSAPVVIACCAETDGHLMKCGHPSFLIDVAIAVDHLTLAAAGEGLGTCWIGAFDQGAVRSILGIPEEIQVVELLPLGYPDDTSTKQKQRYPMGTIVHRERWAN
jgi:nitroreductase